MKMTLFSKLSLITTLVMMTLLEAAFFPSGSVSAHENSPAAIIGVPAPKAPLGVITDTTPTYKWTIVPGADKYQYQIYKGGTLVFSRYLSGSSCGAATCEDTPADTFYRATFKWRIRAHLGGAWKPWSTLKEFIISAPPTSFNTGFPNCMVYWARKSGGEWKVTEKYLYSNGLPDKCSAVYRTTSRAYANFEYSTKMKINGEPSGGLYPEAYMALRMGNGVNASDSCWYSGYLFGYSRDGKYSIWKMNADGSKTKIKGPTYSSAINKNFWNWTRVVAIGDHFDFYINDKLLESFTDKSFSIGWIGYEMKNHGTVPTTFYLDWTTLKIIP